jgi:hypothetical protein
MKGDDGPDIDKELEKPNGDPDPGYYKKLNFYMEKIPYVGDTGTSVVKHTDSM